MKYLIALLLAWSTACAGQSYYVTTDGVSSNSGLSWGSPWSLVKACTSLSPGDVVMVRQGSYPPWNSYCEPSVGGTQIAPITIKGEEPLAPPTMSRAGGWAFIKVPWIVIENIACTNMPAASCISIKDTHHITLRAIRADHNWRGININHSDSVVLEFSSLTYNQEGVYVFGNSNRNRISKNIVKYNGHGNTGDRCGICIGESNAGSMNVINGNDVAYNGALNSDAAIIAYSAPRTLIFDNYVHSNYGGGIMVTQFSIASVVDKNRVEYNGKGCKLSTNISSISVRNGSSGTVVSNNTLRNNCVSAGNQWGETAPRGALDIRGWADKSTDNVTFLNNTVTGTINGPDFFVDPKSNIKDLVVQ